MFYLVIFLIHPTDNRGEQTEENKSEIITLSCIESELHNF